LFSRALSDQLALLSLETGSKNKKGMVDTSGVPNFKQLRVMAADYIRSKGEDFAPFLGCSPEDEEFETYCQKVASDTLAEWGGQVEIRALSESLERPIYVYSSDAPILKTGEQFEKSTIPPLKLSFHRHLYTLGEHYNSLIPHCDCDSK
jgi:OTU domain-containing protein 6